MARLSPITLSLVALIIAILGGTVLLIMRSHHLSHEPVSEVEPAAPVPTPPPTGAPEPAPPPPTAPVLAAAEVPADVDAQPSAEEQPPPAPNRRGLLVVNHNRRLQEADENVFVTLAVPESTRVAIRQINEDYRRRTEAGADAAPGATTPTPTEAASALKARQDALTSLLGSDPAKAFDAEERMAVMRLRGKYRYVWGKQLRQ